MHHDVRAVFQRTEQERRSEGAVHNEGNAVGMGDFRQGFHVRNIAVRVAQALHVQGLGVFPDGLGEIVHVPGVHEGGFNPAFRERVGKQVVRASVHGGRGNDVVPGAGDVLDGVGDGGGPGGYGQRGGSAFQRGDAFFKNVRRGVHQAVVNIARLRQGKTSGGLRGVLEDVGSGCVNRNGAGVRNRVGILLAHVELACFKSIFSAHVFIFLSEN